MTIEEAVGLAIIVQRKILKISQPSLAKSIGISPSGLSRIESATVSINVGTLDKIARAFSMSISDLVKEGETLHRRGVRP